MNLSDLGDDISERIVEFDLSEDRTRLNVYECCDVYFEAHLTRAQVTLLIGKLDELRGQMFDESSPQKDEG